MDPSERRSPIVIQQHTGTRDATTNEISRAWTTLKTIFGQISPIRGREHNVMNSQETYVTHLVRCHHYDVTDVTNAMRIVYEGTVFNITHILRDFEEHKEATIGARETDEAP